MMRHPERWDNLLLPVKHRSRREDGSTFPLLGFLFEDAKTRQAAPKVYIGCMFMAADAGKLATEEYANLDALVNAGWRVD